MKLIIVLFAILLVVNIALCDIYMHNPRGSNNRLNGRGANRANGNRLCDTQNNGAGGYCWGPSMTFYSGSQLSIEWTNQHSCGMENANCNVVIQVMAEDYMRDGNVTTTIPDNANTYDTLVTDSTQKKYGMHEHYDYYQNCKARERNKGLFIANNNIGNPATRTRQNNGGTRRGFECPEEKDYYPYWHPTPWIDIAVLTTQPEKCEFYKKHSHNVRAKNYCNDTSENNEVSCPTGQWFEQPAINKQAGFGGVGAPICQPAPWNRDNHLGNGINGYPNNFNWTIPTWLEGKKCVLRIRYNISTNDYDPWTTDHKSNGIKSPIKNDPYVEIMNDQNRNTTLRLAINTDQFGRTFQDRSHIFNVRKRPDGVGSKARIFNLNVRGKRGNIVQAYPAVEYDFVPNHLMVRPGDYIHMQWTGCDTNPNGFAGEGRSGTDRSNIAQVKNPADSIPAKWNELSGSERLFKDADFAYNAAYIGQTNCKTEDELNNNEDQDPQNCFLLNAAPTPYYDLGLYKVSDTGIYYYISTRNNNFSNRSQKGTIESVRALRNFGIAVVSIGSAGFLVALVFAGLAAVAQASPSSALGGAAVFNAK